jgi:hypothetical protein
MKIILGADPDIEDNDSGWDETRIDREQFDLYMKN